MQIQEKVRTATLDASRQRLKAADVVFMQQSKGHVLQTGPQRLGVFWSNKDLAGVFVLFQKSSK